MFKRKSKKSPAKSAIPEIPESYYTKLLALHQDNENTALNIVASQNMIDTDKLKIKRNTQQINQLSFKALLAADLDPTEYLVDLDTMKFKKKYTY